MAYRLQRPVWHGLLARAVLLEARAERLGMFAALLAADSAVVRGIYEELHLGAAHAGGEPSDATAIGVAEDRLQAKLDDVLEAPGLTADEIALCRSLKSSRSCAGDDPFGRVYREVVQHAATLFGGAWPGTPELMVLPLGRHPRTPADQYAVTGQTTRAKGRVTVELHIHPDGLGPATFLVFPLVLVHECVCHVVDLSAGLPVNNASPFAEGLMDWAAHYHFLRWLPFLCPRMAGAASTHAKLFSAAAVPRGHRSYSPRLIGWSAANALVIQLADHGLPVSQAETLVASFALRVSLSAASPDARDVLVQRIEYGSRTLAEDSLRQVVLDDGPVDALF